MPLGHASDLRYVTVAMALVLSNGSCGGRIDSGGEPGAGHAMGGGSNLANSGNTAGANDNGLNDTGPSAMLKLSNVAVWADCMPAVPPDPIYALWDIEIDTAPTLSNATLLSAQLTLLAETAANVTSVAQSLSVDNPTVTLVNGVGTQHQRKTYATSEPPSVCMNYCSTPTGKVDTTWKLELTFDVGSVSGSGNFECAY